MFFNHHKIDLCLSIFDTNISIFILEIVAKTNSKQEASKCACMGLIEKSLKKFVFCEPYKQDTYTKALSLGFLSRFKTILESMARKFEKKI